MKLNKLELNSVLAGLRLLQHTPTDQLPPGLLDMVLLDGTDERLSDTDIDNLCERINVDETEQELWVVAIGDAFNGTTLYGPYPCSEDAMDSVDGPLDGDWHAVEVFERNEDN